MLIKVYPLTKCRRQIRSLANLDQEYINELAAHHVGGHLKVAPEHTDANVLGLMRKPATDDFEKFAEVFDKESKKAGKKQYIIPYFIASHPGSDLNAMIDLAVFLRRGGYTPDQVQDFIPAPFDVATAMYYTGLDPFTRKPVHIAKHLRDRKLQRALMQFFKPENYFEVRKALEQAGRHDLIGGGCDALIPSRAPKEAIDARRKDAGKRFRSESARGKDEDDKPVGKKSSVRKKRQSRSRPGKGYRPDRKSN